MSFLGVILFKFEKVLKLFGCVFYFVIGLLCLGVFIVGGVVNNLGGVFVKRGFVYIELLLFV